ncbi:hypothetical protein SYNPS1DRAFT_27663 [Syncephalis pseudoplumigaleata]|uniref:Uncharacterized protein n=1 Tax=Syncephalis pseudoplumigaleata TaxID=1712513 RepID=A0A4P9Z2A4_9FUNG|nr:hypothetical protein SYNPS1DRAFT_27663 [Syncephalis pseudoplumigaleata]|eukprot:RKP26657.1 hypothetical protein SYNPS1DRAFT_27663 [Syncephalis pseudoplumigaleata]
MAVAVANDTADNPSSLIVQSPPLSVNEINDALRMSAMLQQPDTSMQLFEHMKTLKIVPDLRSYNHLIDVHASMGDLDKVAQVYRSVEEAELTPNEYTMGALIKAYVVNKRIDDAFKTYQTIITMLIKGCVQAGQLDRAWTTFDRMRFELCRPDEVSYSLMIYACAKWHAANGRAYGQGNQVERAMNLFEEMVKAGLYPTDVTFNALISACAPHYYTEAFQLLIQMADYGFMADVYTYNALLSAAAHRGDIERARHLFTDMVNRAQNEPELMPDESTYTNMFLAYAATARNGWMAEATRRLQEQGRQARDNGGTADTPPTNKPPMLSLVPGKEGPLLPFLPATRTHVLVEGRRLFNHVLQQQQQSTDEQPGQRHLPAVTLSTQLVNGYLALQTSHRVFKEADRVYDHVYDELGLTRDGWTYAHMLQLYTERSGWIQRAWQIWHALQQWWKAEDEDQAVSAVNKAIRRRELGCEPKQRHQAYVLMINGLARAGDLQEALKLLQTLDSQSSRGATHHQQQGRREMPRRDGRGQVWPELRLAELSPLYQKTIRMEADTIKEALLDICYIERRNTPQSRLARRWGTSRG